MSTTRPTPAGRHRLVKWATPALGIIMGVAYLVAEWVGGHPWVGAELFALMAVFTLGVVLAARRSETVRGLLDRRDERIADIDLRATAFAGIVLITVILVAVVVEIARGHDGTPYVWLGAVAGVSYLAAVVVLRVSR